MPRPILYLDAERLIREKKLEKLAALQEEGTTETTGAAGPSRQPRSGMFMSR
jgi:hypothetical protein